MRKIYFNFANEAGQIELNQNTDTNVITIEGREDLASFDSIEQFAESFALARGVQPDRLKNWVLIEDGDMYSFVLRAGTAGISASEIDEEIFAMLAQLADEGDVHTLVVNRLRAHLIQAGNVVNALGTFDNQEVAQRAYDILDEMGAFVEPEVDNRSNLEILLDNELEEIGSVALFAKALNLPVTATKDEILRAADLSGLGVRDVLDIVERLIEQLYAVTDVSDRVILTALVAQSPVGLVDEEAVAKIKTSMMFAGTAGINLPTIKVGARFVKCTASMVAQADLDVENIRVVNGHPVLFQFDAEFDAELEAEILDRRAKIEAAREAELDYHPDYDEDNYYDEDEDDYEY